MIAVVRPDSIQSADDGTPGLGDANGVKALQSAMQAMAKKRNDPSMDPGSVDGIVGQRTLTALLSILQLIPIPKLSGTDKTLILAALGFAVMPGTPTYDIARNTVSSYASKLAPALVAATAIVDAGGPNSVNTPGAGLYPLGTVARFNKSRKVWRIYAPVGLGIGGLPGAALNGLPGIGLGACANSASGGATSAGPCGKLDGLPGAALNGLGDAVADASSPPPGTTLVGESAALPAGVTNAGVEDLPFWKKWQFWVPIGLGAAVAGVGYHVAKK